MEARNTEEVAAVRRELLKKGSAAKAEYQNLKSCMETGSRKVDKGTQEPHCEGECGRREKKSRRLSSQNLNGTGRKKGTARGSIAWKGKTGSEMSACGTAVGAKQERTKGNKQGAE